MIRKTLLLFALLLAGCGLAGGDVPTPLPTGSLLTPVTRTGETQQVAPASVESATHKTGEPTDILTLTPTRTPTPSPPPSPTGTQALTPLPTVARIPVETPRASIPLAEIEITNPGPLSKVRSPIKLRALLVPGAEGRVTVELLGEDGRLLVRQIQFLNENLGRKAGLAIDVDFEIAAVAELGRLQVAIDDEYGRPKALASVDLILLSEGDADINVPGDRLARIVVEEPLPGALVQGGKLILAGLARPVGDPFLVVELVAQDGKVVGNRLVEVPDGPEGEHRPYVAEIPYTVSDPTWVRVIVRERGTRIPGAAYLSSVEVLLSP